MNTFNVNLLNQKFTLIEMISMLVEQYSKPNYEVTNGLLGMKKYFLLRLIIIHNNNTLYKFEKVIKAMLKSYKRQIEKHKINTNYHKPRSSFEIHRTKEILKTDQIGHYEKYCENIYIYNNVLTIKHLLCYLTRTFMFEKSLLLQK
jgi:hypothetical protein